MDFNVEKQQLCSCRIVREAKAEQGVDCDMTLPDYCPDIKSILRCSVEPGINSVSVTGNRITAEGNAVIRLVYVSTADKISCFEQNYPLSKYVEMNSLSPESQVVATAKTSYVNCRAVSPRRVDVHGCISVLFSLLSCEKADYVSGILGEGMQLKLQPLNCCSCVGCTSKLFEMSEVIPIKAGTSSVKSVMHAEGYPMISELKAVNNKILLKGELVLNIELCCEDGSAERVEHSMPISRIIELDGVDEACICDVKTDVSSVDIRLKPDENGEMKDMDAAVCVKIVACGYKKMNDAYVQDAYSLKNELDISSVPINAQRFTDMLDEKFLVTFQADLSGAEAGEIVDSWCDNVTCVSSECDDGIELSGTITLSILYLDTDDKPMLAQRQNDYHFVKPYTVSNGKLMCDAVVSACGVSVSGKGASVGARVQLQAKGCVFESCQAMLIADVRLNENSEKSGCASSVTVYFSDVGEKIWDIAKKYNTSEEAIRRQNSIKGDTLEKETMLIIPQI